MPSSKAHYYEEKGRVDTSSVMSDHEHVCHDQSIVPILPLKRTMSMKEFLILFSMSFCYAICFNTLNNIVIPKTVARLTDSLQSLWLGRLMALGAFCQMSAPVVGAYSDRIGSRTFFLIYGSIVTVIGLFLYILVEITESIIMLSIAQIISTIGLSIMYSMIGALLNDYVIDEQMGKGNGVMAVLALIGSGTGYAMLALDVPITYCLCSYVLIVLFCLLITISFIPTIEPIRQLQQPFTFFDTLVVALTVPSYRVFPDFILSCIGRALFNFGLAGQVYLVFFVRDVFASSSPVRITSVLSIAALFGGLVGAIPSGIFSDRVGRKPVVYVAVLVCVISLVLLLIVRELTLLYAVGFLYGIGSASFLSVDHALGVATLPRKCGTPIDAAKDLGLFATSATIGTLGGQIVYSTVLHAFLGHTAAGAVRYNSIGFVCIYSIACLAFIASGITVALIKVK